MAVPQLGSCASSERPWRLWAVRHSQEEAGPLGARPLPRVLEPAASTAAHFPALAHLGSGKNPNVAKRAQISANAGDAPAEYVPSGPRRVTDDGRAAVSATEHRRNSRRPPPQPGQPQRKPQQQQSPTKRGVSGTDRSAAGSKSPPMGRRPARAGLGPEAETSGDARTRSF